MKKALEADETGQWRANAVINGRTTVYATWVTKKYVILAYYEIWLRQILRTQMYIFGYCASRAEERYSERAYTNYTLTFWFSGETNF